MSQDLTSEKHIQNVVADKLPNDYYGAFSKCYVKKEEYTNQKNRADVFIALNKRKNHPYGIVVEVKSRNTLDQLKPKLSYQRQVFVSKVITTVLFSSVFFCFGYGLYVEWFSLTVLLLVFSVFVYLGIWIISNLNIKLAKTIPVIEQLDKYPANEKWVAYSFDTFTAKKDEQLFVKSCRKKGVGVIRMRADEQLEFIHSPCPILETNSYVNRYQNASEIIAYVNSLKVYRRSTKAEKLKVFHQLKYVFLAGLFVCFVFMLSPKIFSKKPLNLSGRTKGSSVEEPSVSLYQEEGATNSDGQIVESIENKNGLIDSQPCHFMDSFLGRFMVVDQICKSREIAVNRVEELQRAGFKSTSFIGSECFRNWVGQGQFLVHTNEIFDSQEIAEENSASYKRQLSLRGLNVKYGKPMQIKAFK